MEEWSDIWEDASCVNQDSTIFFLRSNEVKAKEICAGCPIKNMCLEYALIYNTYGVWGGMSYNERKRSFSSSYREDLRWDYKETGTYNRRLKL